MIEKKIGKRNERERIDQTNSALADRLPDLSSRKPFLQFGHASPLPTPPPGLSFSGIIWSLTLRTPAKMALVESDRNLTRAGFSQVGYLLAPKTEKLRVELTSGAQPCHLELASLHEELCYPLCWSQFQEALPTGPGGHQ